MDTDKLNKVILKAHKSGNCGAWRKMSKSWELIDNPSLRIHDVLGSSRSTFTKG